MRNFKKFFHGELLQLAFAISLLRVDLDARSRLMAGLGYGEDAVVHIDDDLLIGQEHRVRPRRRIEAQGRRVGRWSGPGRRSWRISIDWAGIPIRSANPKRLQPSSSTLLRPPPTRPPPCSAAWRPTRPSTAASLTRRPDTRQRHPRASPKTATAITRICSAYPRTYSATENPLRRRSH